MALRNDYEVASKSSVRELYRFFIGDKSSFDYRFTNHDTDYVDTRPVTPEVYSSVNITRSKIKQSTGEISNELEIEVPDNNPVAVVYKKTQPDSLVEVAISAAYDESLGVITDPENLVFWKGAVVDSKFSGTTCILTCKSKFSVLNRLALRRRITVHCPYALFSLKDCGVPKGEAARQGVVTAITSPTNIVVDESPGGSTLFQSAITNVFDSSTHYDGGFAHYVSPASGIESRVGIASSTAGGQVSGDTYSVSLVLDRPIAGLATGSVLTLYAGCNRSVSHCYHKFNNFKNYGGIPHLAGDDPFSIPFRTPLS